MIVFQIQAAMLVAIANVAWCGYTLKQQSALKCQCIVEFLLFSYKRLCIVHFRI